ncbi:MAG TPA: hypothetical protein VF145_03135 [Chitinophagaceae bacterium]
MSRLAKIILLFLLFGLLAFGIVKGYIYYLNHKPHRDVSKEQGIRVTARQIFSEFQANESLANQKYLNNAVEVTGEVAEAKTNQDNKAVVLLKADDPVFGVNCTFKEDPGPIQPGTSITFKGICTGFLSDVVINEGVLVK